MSNDDTELLTVNCPHEGCGSQQTALVPEGATVTDTSPENDDRPGSTGKVRVDCDGHRFYVHFTE